MKPIACFPNSRFHRLFAITTALLVMMGLMIAPALPGQAVALAQHTDTNQEEAYFVVGFLGSDAEFVIKLVDHELIELAREVLADKDDNDDVPDPPFDDTDDPPEIGAPLLVIGQIIPRPAAYNPDWSYHLDPESISFAEAAIGTCSASPEEVEERLDEVGDIFLPEGFWCPWNSHLMDEVPPPDHDPERPFDDDPNVPPDHDPERPFDDDPERPFDDDPDLPAECVRPDNEADLIDWEPPEFCFPDSGEREPALPPQCFPPEDARLDWEPPVECFEDDWADLPECDKSRPNPDGTYPDDCLPPNWDGGSISGQVTSVDGEPLPFIAVEAYQRFDVDAAEDGRFPIGWAEEGEWFPVGWAETMEDGTYHMPYLMPGTYRIKFTDWLWNYHEEFYDDQPTLENSVAVTVTLDEDTPNIDASLAPAQPSITGMVTDVDGNPLPYTSVEVYQQIDISQIELDDPERLDFTGIEGDGWVSVRWVETDEDGTYSVNGLPASTYRVRFANWDYWTYQYEYYDDQPDIDSATDIVVSDTITVNDINAVLAPPPPSITGTVTDDEGEAVPDVSVVAYERVDWYDWYGIDDTDDLDIEPFWDDVIPEEEWFPVGWAETDEDGTYSINGLSSGDYRVEFFHWSFREEFYNDQPTLESADEISVVEGEATTDINASLTPRQPSITGTVTRPDGEPLPFIIVTAWQNIDGIWEPVSWAETDEEGAYTITDLESGDYRVGFDFWRGSLGYYNNARDLERADDVAVTAGEVTDDINATFDIPVDPWGDWDEGFIVTDPETGETNVHIWEDASRDLTITRTITCETGVADEVLLRLTPFEDGTPFETTMEPVSGSDVYTTDIYSGTIPADALVPGDLTIVATCSNGDTQEIAAGGIELIDPSGQITDAETGTPIEGARVDLYTVSEWEPKTDSTDNRPNTCHTTLTKGERPWSDLPAASANLGQLADPASGRIEPQQNPLVTGSDGRFAWNVAQGCWYVEVHADGYEPVISPVVGVPPEVTDLDLALTPLTVQNQATTSTVYLPLVAR